MAVQAVSPRYLRLVLVASAVGTVIEWVRLLHLREPGAVLSTQFSKADPVAAFLSTVALFTIGFLIRPLGAFVFGRIGRCHRTEVHLPGDADRMGSRGSDWCDPDVRADRALRPP